MEFFLIVVCFIATVFCGHTSISSDVSQFKRALISNVSEAQSMIDSGLYDKYLTRGLFFMMHFVNEYFIEENFELLLKSGADMEAVNKNGQNGLEFAVVRENSKAVEILLRNGANPNQFDKNNSISILETAIMQNFVVDASMTELLIKHGADMNHTNAQGESALHQAMRIGNPKVPPVLIEHGANVNAKDRQNRTPLHFAAMYDHWSREDRISIAEMLLDRGADVYAEDNEGNTALDLANSRESNVSEAQSMIDSGLYDKYLTRGLFYMMQFVNEYFIEENFELLLKSGADMEAVNENGQNALEYAVVGQNSMAVEILLRNGANPNQFDNNNRTSMLQATIPRGYYPSASITESLVKHGADVNLANEQGETPLHIAIKEGNPRTPPILINHGANVNAKEKTQNRTPLHYVAIYGRWSEEDRMSIAEMLLDHGADVYAEDNDGNTALDIANTRQMRKLFGGKMGFMGWLRTIFW
ncbi:Ankyrin-3 [Pseudolycoriella hygida]|uniref:Ankyrin-3 n=1 Tax=Pseudolycoriella hygida TaxID=35572 RepID=A0A9Q0N242_9DIPT|nr:Ankyrin-3 [Pseudolycoriella hygida]